MSIFKKIIATLVLLSLFITNFALADTMTALMVEPQSKDLILVTEDLKSIKNWNKYITQIDSIVNKYKNNKTALNKLSLKIIKAKSTLTSNNESISKKKQNLLTILEYLDLKIKIAIYNLYKSEISKKKIEEFSSSLGEVDNTRVNSKLIQIQLNLFEKASNNLNKLLDTFNELTNYEEKWNLFHTYIKEL